MVGRMTSGISINPESFTVNMIQLFHLEETPSWFSVSWISLMFLAKMTSFSSNVVSELEYGK